MFREASWRPKSIPDLVIEATFAILKEIDKIAWKDLIRRWELLITHRDFSLTGPMAGRRLSLPSAEIATLCYDVAS